MSFVILLEYVHSIYIDLLNNKEIKEIRDSKYGNVQKYLLAHKNENMIYWRNYISKNISTLNLNTLLSDLCKRKIYRAIIIV